MRDRLSISRICSILILVTLLLSTTSIVTGTMSSENNSIGRSEFSISQEYTPHENIWIKSDSELLTLAANEGWVGTGTKENPIIIEGYSFFDTEMQPVRFWDTTLHWIFRSNRVSTATEWCGIWALRTQNGIVSNNTFDACHSGAYLEHVQGMIIENNTFQHNTGSGVDGDNPVSDLIIRNNEIYDQNVDGIIFKYPATNVTIINNYIHDNTYDTIDIQFGEDITIQDNVMKNHRYGIKIGNTVTGCIVEENTIQNILNSG
ncbi:MAG: right-handed parallel beta-helix repeat-containing protein, partial [Candidatus Thorarchaeota archaeon]